MNKLERWIEDHMLDCDYDPDRDESLIESPIGRMLYIKPIHGRMVGLVDYEDQGKAKSAFGLMVSGETASEAQEMDITHYVYMFGERFYYAPINEIIGLELKPFLYIEKAYRQFSRQWPFLGVHGRYELMNGTRDYSDWCKKASFLEIDSLGICERHTLAGTLPFQNACKKAGIKPIIGGSYNVEASNGQRYEVKLYVQNAKGWRNLLNINKIVGIDNEGDSIEALALSQRSEGLVCVLKPGNYSTGTVMDFLNRCFEHCYYQLDTVEYEVDDRDKDSLQRTKDYFDTFMAVMPPVLINDAYYLEPEDQPIKEILNNAGSVKGEEVGLDQFFKSVDDNLLSLVELFEGGIDNPRLKKIINVSVSNAQLISELCDFEIDTQTMHLPLYKMTSEESKKYQASLDRMFNSLVEDAAWGLIDNSKYTEDEVWDRIEDEVRVIKKGGYISYFLILWDICNYCKDKGILTGIGRGSAGGSLVAYLLGIIKINPLDYDLLFERFLNEGRMKGSFPDIDTDFEGIRRDEVKRYMEEKYGKTKVASIGTYTTLQTKNAIKELARAHGSAGASTMNYITSILDGSKGWSGLFEDALRKPKLKEFVEKNPEVFEDIPLCLNSPKSQSVHPCATVIIPDAFDEDGNELSIFDVLPMRRTDDGMLVTEWEGGEIESAGFLKEDILGIKQLDKLRMIFNLIEETTGKTLTLEDIPLDDPGTLDLFKEGFNEDVFHFGSEGLSGYSYQVKPDSINDLINMNALFRPGPMGSGSHNKYVKLKNGLESPEYDFGTEEQTKDTFGLMIFQEQIMLICQNLGGFSLVEADMVRKGMGKKKMDLLNSYKPQFVEGAIGNGCKEDEAEEIWEKMISFGAYGFNKSHAAAYSITGYSCNWLKCHYPMQFWVTALHFARDEKIPAFVSEIHKTGAIEIVPPAINDSGLDFIADYTQEKIYWAINKIKYVGDMAVSVILRERDDNGRFFSLEEFLERMEKRVLIEELKPNPVNKRVVTCLTLAGAFDELEGIKHPKERFSIIKKIYEIRGIKEKDWEDYMKAECPDDEFWIMMQRELSGLGEFDLKKTVHKTSLSHIAHKYMDPKKLFADSSVDEIAIVGGLIHNIRPGNPARNSPAIITLVNNDEMINIKVWCKHWTGEQEIEGLVGFADAVTAAKGRLLFISGKVAAPWGPEQHNTLQTTGAYKGEESSVFHII